MSPPRKLLCVQCLSTTVAAAATVYAGSAFAGDGVGTVGSLDAWLAIIFAILSALIAGYARGIDNRLTKQEAIGSSNRDLIGTLRSDMLREHASKQEMREHRQESRDNFDRVHARLDEIAGMVGRRRGDQ